MSLYDSSSSHPQVISFNSKDRVGGGNSNFLSAPVDIGVNKFNAVCLLCASIPKSYYNMPTNYNTFTLTEKAVSTTITIPIGSYNKITLASTLSSLLTAGSTTLGNNWTYVVSNPPTTGPDTFKFTFTVSGNGLFQPTITMGVNSPFRQLGFEQSTVYPFLANTLVSANAINLAYVLRMFIKSNICSDSADGILDEILSVGSFAPQSVIFYQQFNIDVNTRIYNTNNTNSWNFVLTDSYGQEIDLNGIPWAFTLVFYQRNDTHEIHKNELIINNEQRLFQIEQTQKKLIESVKDDKKEERVDDSASSGKPGETGELSKNENEAIYPVKPVYVLPELTEPIDYIKLLNI
jgi:hypothetical protein